MGGGIVDRNCLQYLAQRLSVMNQDQVPKYLALSQKLDAMYDDRVCESMKNQIKPSPKVLELTSNTTSNKVIDYSNRYAIMVYCSPNDVGIKSLGDLNQEFTTEVFVEKYLGLELQETPFIVQFSPEETLLAVVMKTRILVFQTSTLKSSKVPVHTIPVSEIITDISWTNQVGILFWKYKSTAHHYSLSSSKSTPLPGVECCSAQLINNHFVLTEEFNVRMFDSSYNLTQSITYPDDTYKSDDFYGINMEDVISIAKLNNLSSHQFKEDDLYAFITVFSEVNKEDDEDDAMLPNKYLFFARGDIRTENVEFRGGELLYHNYNDPEQYIEKREGREWKRGFSVKSYLQPITHTFIFSIDRTGQIYAVDTSLGFEGLKLVDFPGKYQFRFDGMLIGFTLLRNLLEFERTYTKDNEDMKMITEKFGGRFLNIGIKDKDKDIYVPFPFSVLSWNKKGVQNKQYFVKTEKEVDAEATMDVKERKMKEIVDLSPIVNPDFGGQRGDVQKEIKAEARPEKVPKEASEKAQETTSETAPEPKTESQPSSNLPSVWGSQGGAKLFDFKAGDPNIFTSKPGADPANIPLLGNLNFLKPPAPSSNIFDTTGSSNKPVQNKLNFNFPPKKEDDKDPKDTSLKPGVSDPKPNLNPFSNAINPPPKAVSLTTNQKQQTPSAPIISKPQPIPKRQPNLSKQKQEQRLKQEKKEAQEAEYLHEMMDRIDDYSNQFQSFLEYVSEFDANDLPNLDEEQPIIPSMINFLKNIKKEEQMLDMAILQMDILSRKSHAKFSERLELHFQSGLASNIENQIRDKLDAYNSLSEKIMYVKLRLANSQNLSILGVKSSKPNTSEISKIVSQQTRKITSLHSKVDQLYQKHRSLKKSSEDLPQFNGNSLTLKFQEESDEDVLSLEDILKGYITKVVEVDATITSPTIDLGWLRAELEEERKQIRSIKGRGAVYEELDAVQNVNQKKPLAQSKEQPKPVQSEKKENRVEFMFKHSLQSSEEEVDQDLLPNIASITQQMSSLAPDTKIASKKEIETKKEGEKQPVTKSLFAGSGVGLFNTSKPSEKQEKPAGQGGLFGNKPLPVVSQSLADAGKKPEVPNQTKKDAEISLKKQEKKQPSSLFANLANNDIKKPSGVGLFDQLKKPEDEKKKEQTKPPSIKLFLNPPAPASKPSTDAKPEPVPSEISAAPKSSEPAIMSDIHTALINKEENQEKPIPPAQNKPKDSARPTVNLFGNVPVPKDDASKKAVNLFPKPAVGAASETDQSNQAPNIFKNEPKDNQPAKPVSFPSASPNLFAPSKPLFPNPTATTQNPFNSNPTSTAPTTGPSFGSSNFGTSSFGTSNFGNKPALPQAPPAQPANTGFSSLGQGQFKGFGTTAVNSQSSPNIFNQMQSNMGSNNLNNNNNPQNSNVNIFNQPNNNNTQSNNPWGSSPQATTGTSSFLGVAMNTGASTNSLPPFMMGNQASGGFGSNPNSNSNPSPNIFQTNSNSGQPSQSALFAPRK